MARPDYIACVFIGMGDRSRETWCGGAYASYFTGATHAALNGLNGGRLVACPECVAAITAALRTGHDEAPAEGVE